jgi:hypothetical protein
LSGGCNWRTEPHTKAGHDGSPALGKQITSTLDAEMREEMGVKVGDVEGHRPDVEDAGHAGERVLNPDSGFFFSRRTEADEFHG